MLPTLFDYEGKQLRVAVKNGEPYFCAADVCGILDIGNPTDAVKRLDEDELDSIEVIDSLGRTQVTNGVNEPGLYSLVLGSRKPEAKQFKRWITHEVIPQIRKTGTYSLQSQDSYMIEDPIARAKRWIEEQEEKKLLQTTLEEQKPQVLFAKAVEASQNSILVGELAKLLRQNGVNIEQNRLFEKLREEGYLIKRGESYNQPTQYSMELGLFEIKKRVFNEPNGTTRTTATTKVTGKGQIYFINKFKTEMERRRDNAKIS